MPKLMQKLLWFYFRRMGQINSSDKKLSDDVEIFGEEVFRHARLLSELATLTYEEFLDYVKQLNGL